MNGRVYDPHLGKMMSADPTIPGPFNSQAFNRYSYVLNNPLGFTDPSGFSPNGNCGGSPRCQPVADGAGGYDFGMQMPNEWRRCQALTGSVTCSTNGANAGPGSVPPYISNGRPVLQGGTPGPIGWNDSGSTPLDGVEISGRRLSVDAAARAADIRNLLGGMSASLLQMQGGLSQSAQRAVRALARHLEVAAQNVTVDEYGTVTLRLNEIAFQFNFGDAFYISVGAIASLPWWQSGEVGFVLVANTRSGEIDRYNFVAWGAGFGIGGGVSVEFGTSPSYGGPRSNEFVGNGVAFSIWGGRGSGGSYTAWSSLGGNFGISPTYGGSSLGGGYLWGGGIGGQYVRTWFDSTFTPNQVCVRC